MPLDHLISEFIQALLQEIKAQKMRVAAMGAA